LNFKLKLKLEVPSLAGVTAMAAFAAISSAALLYLAGRARGGAPPVSLPADEADNPRAVFSQAVSAAPSTFPLSARWLAAAHTPGAPLKYSLRGGTFASGLRPLAARLWLEVDPCPARLRRELLLKRALLARGGPFFSTVVAAEEGTVGAQGAVLRMVLEALRGSPAHALLAAGGGAWDGAGDALAGVAAVRVAPTGDTHALRDWAHAPLALACLLVQEDFILLRRAAAGARHAGAFVFCAGAACFSFSEVGLRGERGNMALGEPMGGIHTAVPGFAAKMAAGLGRVFDGLREGEPMYRANWGLAPNGTLSPFEPEIEDPARPRHTFSRAHAGEGVVYAVGALPPSRLWLKVEHQTIHRVPVKGEQPYVLFTVRTYSDPLPAVVAHSDGARAAAVLADAIDSLKPEQLAYRDLADAGARGRLCKFLRRGAPAAGSG
jgi:hypothetical protein